MNEFYAKGEMPKCCKQCPCRWGDEEIHTCQLEVAPDKFLCLIDSISWNEQRPTQCPLKSLTDHDKETKMKLIEGIQSEIQQLIEDKNFELCNWEYANGFCFGLQYALGKILDKMKKD